MVAVRVPVSGLTPLFPPATPPANITLPIVTGAPPSIAGDPIEGQPLTTTNGAWAYVITYGYQWRRCNAAGGSCADIPDATTATYVPVADDVDSTIRVVVTATNDAGSTSVTSAQTGEVAPPENGPPVNLSLPTIQGTPTSGQVFVSEPGEWDSADPITLTYQWRRCDAAGANCVDIADAIEADYTAQVADETKTLRVRETATDVDGSATADSDASAVIAEPLPPSESVVMADSPTMYLRLGESSGTNANDETANNLDGTYTGGVTLGAAGALTDDADTAASFDGTNDYVRLPSSSLISPGAGPFTVEAWVKADAIGTDRTFYADYGVDQDNVIALRLLANGKFFAYFRDSAGNAVSATSTTTAVSDTWYLVAATRSGTTVRIYVNGAEEASGTGTLGTITVSGGEPGAVGVVPVPTVPPSVGPYVQFWDGSIDEFAIYQTALPGSRLLAHFTAADRPPNGGGGGGTALVDYVAAKMLGATTFWRTYIGYNGAYRTASYTAPGYTEKNAKALVFDNYEQQGHAQQGEVFLAAWLATGDAVHRDAAVEAGQALASSMVLQASGGGWPNTEAWVPGHPNYGFPHHRDDPGPYQGWKLDWSESFYWAGWSIQGTQFLIRLDKALNGTNATIHDACLDSVAGLLQSELPNNSGWPGRVFKSGSAYYAGTREFTWSTSNASFPSWANGTPLNMPAWNTPSVDYWDYKHSQYPFLNDFTHRYIFQCLIEAYRWLGTAPILAAINNMAAYIRRAQMPAPQPGWCQSYDQNVQPKWCRVMEPPALCTRETGETIRMLLEHYLFVGTGNPAHGGQASLDAAIAGDTWLQSVKGVAGNANLWHMFKELVTGNPLYKASNGAWSITRPASQWPGYGFEIADSLQYIPGFIGEIQSLGRAGWIDEHVTPNTAAGYQAQADIDAPGIQAIVDDMTWATLDYPYVSPWEFVNKMRELVRYVLRKEQGVDYPWVNQSTVTGYHTNTYPHHLYPIVVP